MSMIVVSTAEATHSLTEKALLQKHPEAYFLLSAGRPASEKTSYWSEKHTFPELNSQLGRHPFFPYESLLSASEALVIHGDLSEVLDGHLLLVAILCERQLQFSIQIEHTSTLRFFEDSERQLLRQYLSAAKEVFCYSKRNLAELERLLATSIPNGRIVEIPQPAAAASIGRKTPGQIFCPLPLDVVKNGQDLLLSSLSDFKTDKRWNLKLISDGPDRGYLEELAAYLEIGDRLSFCSSAELDESVISSECVALPSRFDTGLYELSLAICAHSTVIATDLGARSELINYSKSCFLVPGANTALLSQSFAAYFSSQQVIPAPNEKTPAPRPKVSVIIPCYNYARFLPQSVGSVLAQTYEDYEVIVINDGSTDDSGAVADSLSREFGITVIHQDNSGQPAIVRNRGFKESTGEYVICLDADDLLAPNLLSRFVEALERDPSVDIAYGEGIFFDEQGKVWRQTTGEFSVSKLKEANQLFYCAMYRRRVFEVSGGYRLNVRGYEDWDFWLGAAKHGFRAVKVPDALLYYRVAPTGLFHNALERDRELRENIAKNHPQLFDPPV